MSLLDVYEGIGGGSSGGLGSSSFGGTPLRPRRRTATGGSLATASTPAASSKERGFPERIDINDFVKDANFGEPKEDALGTGAAQLLEVAGKAPGFAAERPFAVLDQLGQDLFGKSIVGGVEQAVGQIPVVGNILGAAGDVLQRFSSLPAAIANASTAEALKRGTVEGWGDDQPMQTGVDLGLNGGITIGPLTLGKVGATSWGEFKQEQARKGWTAEDVQALIDGKKMSYDFGDHRMSADTLSELALRVASDPTNLLFGVGSAIKAARGASLLTESAQAGLELAKPLAPLAAADAVAAGDATRSTLMGTASYFGTVGRGLGRAYRNIAIGTTAGQLGVGAVDKVVNGDNTPHSGFLEPLFEFNRRAFDNQPLSNNIAFSLWAGFNAPLHEIVNPIKGSVRKGIIKGFGEATTARVISALGEGWGGTREQVLERAGGLQNVHAMVGHAMAQIVFRDIVKNPAVKRTVEGYASMDEAIRANSVLRTMVLEAIDDRLSKGRMKPAEVLQQLRDQHAYRTEGGEQLNQVAFPWHGGNVIDHWNEYNSAVAPVAEVYRTRGDILIGLRDELIDLDLEHAGQVLKLAADAGKTVPLVKVQQILDRYPQLLREDPKWNQYLLPSAEERVPLGPLLGKLKRAKHTVPTARELYHEAGIAEEAASRDAIANPIDEADIFDRVDKGAATVSVSRSGARVRQAIGMSPSSLGDVRAARLDPDIETFETGLGPALRQHGFNFNDVSQAMGSDGGRVSPSVEINTNARLPEMRLMAATLGHMGGQDAVTISVSGTRMRELLLDPNGQETAIQLPRVDAETLDRVAAAVSSRFDDFTVNDATGTIRINHQTYDAAAQAARDALLAEIEGYYPKDLLDQTGVIASMHPAYVERITKRKGNGAATYDDVIRDARRAGDPRADAAKALRQPLSNPRASRRDAAAGLGPEPVVGRDPGAAVGQQPSGEPQPSASGVTPEDVAAFKAMQAKRAQASMYAMDATHDARVEAQAAKGQVGDPATVVGEPGYLYHYTTADAAPLIAGEGLRPQSPGASGNNPQMAWEDGGTGKRAYFTTPDATTGFADAGSSYEVAFRVKEDRAGRLKSTHQRGEQYVTRPISAERLEVWGADGQWHPARGFFESDVEPHIQSLAEQAAPAYQQANIEGVTAPQTSTGTIQPLFPGAKTWDVNLEGYGETRLFGGDRPGLRGPDGTFERTKTVKEAVQIMARDYKLTAADLETAGLGRYASFGSKATPPVVSTPDPLTRATIDPRLNLRRGQQARVLRGQTIPVGPHESITLKKGMIVDVHAQDAGFVRVRVGDKIVAMPRKSLEGLADAAKLEPPDPLTLGLRAQEDGATLGPTDESAALAQVAETGDSAAIERQRLARDESGRGAVLANAKLDAEAAQFAPLNGMLSGEPELQAAELANLDHQLQTHWPQYQVKRAPQANIFDIGDEAGSAASKYLVGRTKLGDALAEWGPTSRIGRFVDLLISPVRNEAMGRAARQELMNQLLPKGAKPKEVDAFLSALRKQSATHTFGSTQFRAFRNVTALGQQAINKVAAGDHEAGLTPIFSSETIAAVGRDNFARVLDRASNRFIRSMDAQATVGGRKGSLARAVGNTYGAFQHTKAGDVSRLASKTFYHVFRFLVDIRYHLMNEMEADILGGTRYGYRATRVGGKMDAPLGTAALSHELSDAPTKAAAISVEHSLEGDTGWMWSRRHTGNITRSFDVARPTDTINILNDLERNDPIIADLAQLAYRTDRRTAIERLGRELTPEEDGAVRAGVTGKRLADEVDQMLYDWDSKGPKTTLIDAARAEFGEDETRRLLPFLQQVYERHDQTYNDIVRMFNGNPDRTTLERVANSYWLYWPISYQLKAGKWLVDTLTQKIGGVETNLAGAALYAHYYEEHKRLMATDPGYISMFKDHPTAWFMAQMMLPITPGDIGVSLSRPVRYTGGALGDLIQSKLGVDAEGKPNRLGLWGSYAAAQDPIGAAGAIMSLGPVYTADLLGRLSAESRKRRSTLAP